MGRPSSSRLGLWEWFGLVLARPIVGQNRVGPKWAWAKFFWLVSPWANDGPISKTWNCIDLLNIKHFSPRKCFFSLCLYFFSFLRQYSSYIFDFFFEKQLILIFKPSPTLARARFFRPIFGPAHHGPKKFQPKFSPAHHGPKKIGPFWLEPIFFWPDTTLTHCHTPAALAAPGKEICHPSNFVKI